MTLRELSDVFKSKFILTINAFFENGEYYSFRSYGGVPITWDKVGEDDMSLEVIGMELYDGKVFIDAKEVI